MLDKESVSCDTSSLVSGVRVRAPGDGEEFWQVHRQGADDDVTELLGKVATSEVAA